MTLPKTKVMTGLNINIMRKKPSCREVQRKTRPCICHHDLTEDKSDDWLEWKQGNTVRKKPSVEKFSVRHSLVHHVMTLPKTKSNGWQGNKYNDEENTVLRRSLV